jgi:hypothetical protein
MLILGDDGKNTGARSEKLEANGRSTFGVRRSALGVRRSAFGVRRSAFGVRREKPCTR